MLIRSKYNGTISKREGYGGYLLDGQVPLFIVNEVSEQLILFGELSLYASKVRRKLAVKIVQKRQGQLSP